MSIPDQCRALLDKDRLAHDSEAARDECARHAEQPTVILTAEQFAAVDDTAGLEP